MKQIVTVALLVAGLTISIHAETAGQLDQLTAVPTHTRTGATSRHAGESTRSGLLHQASMHHR